jgi:hypothetical protein
MMPKHARSSSKKKTAMGVQSSLRKPTNSMVMLPSVTNQNLLNQNPSNIYDIEEEKSPIRSISGLQRNTSDSNKFEKLGTIQQENSD